MYHTIKMPGGRRLLIKKLNKCKGLMKGEDLLKILSARDIRKALWKQGFAL
jgi:hypothetical protein